MSAPETRRLLDVLSSRRTREELSALGYDVRETGRRNRPALVTPDMKTRTSILFFALVALAATRPHDALAAGKQGDIVQTDTLGMNVVSYNLDASKTTTVADSAGLSEFVGAHYFFADGWRVGMNLQFTELLAPSPPPGGNRFSTFALLPQVGWHFYGPLFAALVFGVLPRTGGGANLDLAVQGVFGASIPITDRVNLTGALEVPYNFYIHKTIGLTPLLGVSIRL